MTLLSKLGSILRLPGGSANWDPSWLASIGVNQSGDDINVNATTAMGLSAVNRAVSLLSDSICSTPIKLVKHLDDGGRESVIYKELSLWPMDSKEFLMFDLLLTGNSYALKETMKPIAAWRISVEVLKTEAIQYKVMEDPTINSPAMTLKPEQIIHFKYRTHGLHPYLGTSPISSGAPSLAQIMRIDLATKSIYKNTAAPSILLLAPKPLNEITAKRLREAWQEGFKGNNLSKTAVLDNGITPEFLGKDLPTALDLQLSELSKLSTLEIARLFGIPPQLLAESSDVNNSTSSELSRSFAKFGLGPLAYRMSDVLSHALLSPRKLSQGFRIELDLTNSLIGQGEDRSRYLSQMVNSGIMSLNEARNLSSLPDVEQGDVLRVGVNTISLDHWIDWKPGGKDAYTNTGNKDDD